MRPLFKPPTAIRTHEAPGFAGPGSRPAASMGAAVLLLLASCATSHPTPDVPQGFNPPVGVDVTFMGAPGPAPEQVYVCHIYKDRFICVDWDTFYRAYSKRASSESL